MESLKKYIGDLFAGRNFYYGIIVCAALFLSGFYFTVLRPWVYFLFIIFCALLVLDYSILFFTRRNFVIKRKLPMRLSNGESNMISWAIRNEFAFPVRIELMEEWPPQLEIRDQKWTTRLKGLQKKKIIWHLRPVKRGEYLFGNIHLFVHTPLNIISRRFTTEAAEEISCYPSFVKLNHYGLHSNATVNLQTGSLRMRKIGQSMEFEQIKEYVTGDDIRTINWKASARRGALMINQYVQERAQQVYCIIDKGRLMKMPFNEMSLLDYAVNSSLILSSVCLENRDRCGLITFSNKMDTLLAADNRSSQMSAIIEALYKEDTDFLESDFELLYRTIRSRIKNRSLLILFTNFESVSGLRRQIDYLRSLARYHLVLVVFFENSELKALIKKPASDVEEVYVKTIAEKFAYEKKLIVRELSNYGISSILAKPNELTVKTVNKYLELKVKSAL